MDKSNFSDKWTYLDELAFVLLADAVASELEDVYSIEYAADNYRDLKNVIPRIKKLRDEVVRSQEDICSCLREVCEDRGVDPTPFLPIDLVISYVARVDQAWEGQATVALLYQDMPKGAGRLILGGAGHGVDLGDDQDECDWLSEHGLGEMAHKRAGSISDMYHTEASGLIALLLGKIPQGDGDSD